MLSFDEEYAKAIGIPGNGIHLLFVITVALVIAVSMRIVGVLLVSSLMTLPVAASIRVAKSFKQSIILSVIFGEISVIGGLVSGFYLEIAPGGTIVIIAATLLLGTVLYKKFRYQKS